MKTKKKIKNLTLCFDLDGTICKTVNKNYNKAKPIKHVISLINDLYKNNNIIIFTERYMGRTNDNILMTKKKGYDQTYKQLKKWKIKFNRLVFGKPSYDVFVDDKNFSFKKNWHIEFRKRYLK